MIRRIMLLTVLLISLGASGQVAVKSNLLSDAILSPNVGVEIGIAPKWSADLNGQFNLWTVGHDKRWKHWALQPEVRRWFCRSFSGHFVGAHALGGQYNVGGFNGGWNFLGTDARKLKDFRSQGWFAGLGLAYGYAWILDMHWNIEAEIGLGWTYTRYDKYRCANCGKKIARNKAHNYVGPTKVALNIVYVF